MYSIEHLSITRPSRPTLIQPHRVPPNRVCECVPLAIARRCARSRTPFDAPEGVKVGCPEIAPPSPIPAESDPAEGANASLSRLRVQSRTPRLASPNSKTAKGVPKSEVAREGHLRPSPAASGSAEGVKATRSQLRADVQRSRTVCIV